MRLRTLLLLLSVMLLLAACDPKRDAGGTDTLRITSVSTTTPSITGDLTIYGAGFSATRANTVTIGSRTLNQASIHDASYGEISLTIPPGTPSGALTVTNRAGQSVTYDEPIHVISTIEIDPSSPESGTRRYPITVRAKDTDGQPVPQARLTLSTDTGQGVITPNNVVITDSNGEARVTLDLTGVVDTVNLILEAPPLAAIATYPGPSHIIKGEEVVLTDGDQAYTLLLNPGPGGSANFTTLNRRPEEPGLPPLSAAALTTSPELPAPREVIVSYRTDIVVSSSARESAIAAAGAQRVASHGTLDLVRLTDQHDLDQALERLNADPRVAYAEPNHYVRLASLPTDPYLGKQWGTFAIGAPAAWTLGDAEDVIVAVIDSAIDMTHPDLVDALLPGYDFCADNINCHAFDDDPHSGTKDAEHGTHIAGIIAAAHNNDHGTVGIAPGARILPVKVFPEGNDLGDTYTISLAVRWAAGLPVEGAPTNPNPAHVINLSLGGDADNITLADAISEAINAGAVVVAATGNDHKPVVSFPARMESVIGVGALNHAWGRAAFSNYGAGLDIMAPGHYILASKPGGAVWYMDGTSMATPHVAAAAALLLAHEPTLKPADVKDLLMQAAYLPTGASASQFGAGVLRIDGALGLPAPTNDTDRYASISLGIGAATPDTVATLDLRDGTSTNFSLPANTGPEALNVHMTHQGREFTGYLTDW